jgi:uncharacterized protein
MADMVPKPDYIFDRAVEWQALAEFATDDRLGATLGMVSGRRRQGKTLLLESMCEELGGFLSHVPDAFRANRAEYQITDALIRFHHAIVYPNWSRLDLYRPERAARLWAESAERFRAQVMGPTFEDMCRVWTQEFASGATLGGEPDIVSHGVLNDPAGKSRRQLDIVVRDSRRGLIAIGEVKSGEVIGHGHLNKLREAVTLLRAQRQLEPDAEPMLLLFSGTGFTPELAADAADSGGTVQLIGLERLYSGS